MVISNKSIFEMPKPGAYMAHFIQEIGENGAITLQFTNK